MIDYILKDTTVTFKLLNKVGNECHCTFKINLNEHPCVSLFPGAHVELIEAGSGTVFTVEIVAVDVRDGNYYSSNMTGSCVFRLLSGCTQFGTLGSLV